jgi:membrane protein YdbS with pleckstrin-like domain
VAADDRKGEAVMTPLDPRYVHVLRIRAAIPSAILLLGALAAELALIEGSPLPRFFLVAAAGVIGLLLVGILPRRRYRAWGYCEEIDELHVASGLLVRFRTVVPFGRVQHIDIAQGPLERRFGLTTLILHTAGTRGASVPLPGLEQEKAEGLRDRIRGKIREDLV